jgi:hypothetical protein
MRRVMPGAGLALLCAYFLASWEVRPLFFSNQNTYFLQGLRIAGIEGLQHDWLAGTRSPHLLFTLLVAGLQSLWILTPAVHAIEALLYIALVWSLWVFSYPSRTKQKADESVRFITCGVLLMLLTEHGPWNRLFHWGGVADQYVFGGYLQPSELGILVLVGLAMMQRRRHGWAIACFLAATMFHASYLLSTVIITSALGVVVYKSNRQRALLLLVTFVLGVAPVVAYALSFGADARDTALAHHLLAERILPQHAWPAVWLSAEQIGRIAVMTVGAIVAWRQVERSVALAISGSLALIVFGTVLVLFSGNDEAALLFPWRASAYLYPLSLAIILSAASAVVARVVVRLQFGGWWWPVCAGVVAVLLTAESIRERTFVRAELVFPFAHEVETRTTPDDVIIVPVVDLDLWNRFRLLALRPVFVDHKNHPYATTEVLEWQRRVDAVFALYTLPPERRARRCAELGATYYVESVDGSPNVQNPDESRYRLQRCTAAARLP